MGYIGSAVIYGRSVRALSSSLKAKQTISHPDVVDSRIDWSLYQLGPIEVDGDIAIPVVKTSSGNSFLGFIWEIAVQRDTLTGELTRFGDVILEYSHQQVRTFHTCRVNSLEMRATAGDRVEATINFMGTTADDSGVSPGLTDLSPARVLTWDDVTITAAGDVTFDSCIIREMSFTVNNNCSRNYTFCPGVGLFASNISTGKRHVQGTLGFQGFAATDQPGAEQNRNRFTTNDTLSFDFGGFSRTFRHIIYEFQSIDLNVGLVTSTVNWYAHGGSSGEPAIDA
jgi:hypothetical protein